MKPPDEALRAGNGQFCNGLGLCPEPFDFDCHSSEHTR